MEQIIKNNLKYSTEEIIYGETECKSDRKKSYSSLTYNDVITRANLLDGWQKVIESKTPAGVDRVTLNDFDKELEKNISRILFELDYNLYRPEPAEIVRLKKEIGLVAIKDKIVANSLKEYVNGLSFENCVLHNYGYIKGKSVFQAVDYLEGTREKYSYGYRCDIKDFFHSIDRRILQDILRNLITDNRLFNLVNMFIWLPVYQDGLIKKGEGLLLGSSLSPALSNLYLYEADLDFEKQYPVYIRFSDDMYFAGNRRKIMLAGRKVQERLGRLKLTIHAEKSEYIHPGKKFVYLGHEFGGSKKAALFVTDYVTEKSIAANGGKINVCATNCCDPKISQEKGVSVLKELERKYDEKGYEKKARAAAADMVSLLVQAGDYEGLERLYETAISWKREKTGSEFRIFAKYLKLFVKDTDGFYFGNKTALGIQEYSEYPYEVTAELLEQWYREKKTWAVRPAAADGENEKKYKSRLFIIDLDLNKKVVEEFGEDYSAIRKMLLRIRAIAMTLQQQFRREGIGAYVEDSGYKGCHVWVIFDEPIGTDLFWEKADTVIRRINLPPGCHMEKIPFIGDELIKLPFAVHLVSGERAALLDSEGNVPEDPLKMLEEIRENSAAEFYGALPSGDCGQQEAPPADDRNIPGDEYVCEVEKNCSLIRTLISKGKEMNYLTHFERNALLYVYGHMGEAGRKYLHRLIGYCINYDEEITNRFLEKIQDFPVSCDKLCKRFPELPCRKCDFTSYKLFYPSPVIFAYRKAPDRVVKPDYVNKADRIAKLKQLKEPDREGRLQNVLLELAAQKRKLDRDIEVCKKEIEEYCKEKQTVSGKVKDSALIMDEKGIYIKLL